MGTLFHGTQTRLDKRQDSRGQLGSGCNTKSAWNLTIFVTDIPTDTARCRVASATKKRSRMSDNNAHF